MMGLWEWKSICYGSKWNKVFLLLMLSVLARGGPMSLGARVRTFSFSEKLRNPCALADASKLYRAPLSPEERLDTRRTLVRELKAKVILLNDTAATVLRTNVLHDCSSLKLPPVAIVPVAEDLNFTLPEEALRLFYTSLLNHTAHVMFISEQLRRYEGEFCGGAGLPTAAKTLAANLRELTCVLRLALRTLIEEIEYDDDPLEDEVMEELLSDQPLCSRRSVRDCQTVHSTVTLLTELAEYLLDRDFITDEEQLQVEYY